ncbi:hypothetical protein Bbelb_305920 [Branchiostoma belcheri]|nr:hypothetical protein Bbelb_305920 [Branchiostoma belcheri]
MIRQLAASIPTGTSTSPSMWIRWGRRVPKCPNEALDWRLQNKSAQTFLLPWKRVNHSPKGLAPVIIHSLNVEAERKTSASFSNRKAQKVAFCGRKTEKEQSCRFFSTKERPTPQSI